MESDILKYIQRLKSEWQTHGKIIIGVDFDSTISPYPTIDNAEDIARCIKLLKRCKFIGAYLVVFTCCDTGRYEDILGFCKNNGLEIDAINRNPVPLPFGNDAKPYCNIYLDDRSGFVEAMDILQEAANFISGELNTKSTLNQIF